MEQLNPERGKEGWWQVLALFAAVLLEMSVLFYGLLSIPAQWETA